MRYEHEFQRRPPRESERWAPERGRGPGAPSRERRPRPRRAYPPQPLPPPIGLEAEGYTGPGELGRYGNAPVSYGPDHTYDYHFGDRYGYGPDFRVGEERVRRRQPFWRRGRGR